MPSFTNLGDLVRRDLALDKVAIIDLGGETPHTPNGGYGKARGSRASPLTCDPIVPPVGIRQRWL